MSEFLGERVDVESLDWVITRPDSWIVILYRRTANSIRDLLDRYPANVTEAEYIGYHSHRADLQQMLLKLHIDICRLAGVEVFEPPNIVSDDESDDEYY